jgi:hypothetical protein
MLLTIVLRRRNGEHASAAVIGTQTWHYLCSLLLSHSTREPFAIVGGTARWLSGGIRAKNEYFRLGLLKVAGASGKWQPEATGGLCTPSESIVGVLDRQPTTGRTRSR